MSAATTNDTPTSLASLPQATLDQIWLEISQQTKLTRSKAKSAGTTPGEGTQLLQRLFQPGDYGAAPSVQIV